MKTTLQTLTIGLILILFGCGQSNKKSKITNQTLNKVTVAFSGHGCEGECPYQALSVDNNLIANFYGGPFADRIGFYKGIVRQDVWDSVQSRFAKFISNGIDTTEFEKTDQPFVELVINEGVKKYSFLKNTGKMTSEDLNIFYWFIRLPSKTNSLKKCDSLTFVTSIQYPY